MNKSESKQYSNPISKDDQMIDDILRISFSRIELFRSRHLLVKLRVLRDRFPSIYDMFDDPPVWFATLEMDEDEHER